MATVHISELDAVGDLAGLLAKVRLGVEVVIGSVDAPVAVLRAPEPARRTLAECAALLDKNSANRQDEEFAGDIALAVEAHREPLDASLWD